MIDYQSTQAYWARVRLDERAERRRHKAAVRKPTSVAAPRASLEMFLAAMPAVRGLDWVGQQLRKHAIYRCVQAIVVNGMSATAALRAYWRADAGDPPDADELRNLARQFAAEFKASIL